MSTDAEMVELIARKWREARQRPEIMTGTALRTFYEDSYRFARDAVDLANQAQMPRRATGVRIPADRIAAARLRVKLGEKFNDPAPEWVRRLAEHGQPGGVFGTDSQEIPDP